MGDEAGPHTAKVAHWWFSVGGAAPDTPAMFGKGLVVVEGRGPAVERASAVPAVVVEAGEHGSLRFGLVVGVHDRVAATGHRLEGEGVTGVMVAGEGEGL